MAGIEPATKRLTAALPYQHRTHRIVTCSLHYTLHLPVRTAGFEPAISCARGTRNTKLSHVLLSQSAQRELNSRFLRGMQTGYHYTMGAYRLTKLSKSASRKRDESTVRESNSHPLGTTEESCP